MADCLAELVHETLESIHQLPAGVAAADADQIGNAFDEQQPFDGRLALTTNGDAWQPGPTDVTVAKAAEEAARKLEIFIRPFDQTSGLAAGLREGRDGQQIILLGVDASLAPVAALETVNALVLSNLAVLIVDPTTSAVGADAWLADLGLPTGALTAAKAAGLWRVARPGSLAVEMQQLLDEAGVRISTVPCPAKAIDPALAERVRTNDGIRLDVQPQLTEPGRKSDFMSESATSILESDAPERPLGRIVTFYSYKGGAGRSMALANVAWILAMHGRRVLVVDWDFEAPGLHRYYWPFLPDPELIETPGLIDFFVHFSEAAHLQASQMPSEHSWFYDRTDLTRYSTTIDFDFPDGGVLDFVGTGQQGATYGVRVNTFHWGNCYQELRGGVFLESVKARLRQDYDFILIDNRTGLSDTSGICTMQTPDDLVVCFTLHRQSIYGAAATATSADRQRRRPDGSQGVRIWPVPTRVEMAEKERLEALRAVAREKFAPFLWHIPPFAARNTGATWKYFTSRTTPTMRCSQPLLTRHTITPPS